MSKVAVCVSEKRFNAEGINIIEACKFEVFPGEFVSIVGPSGCGKSTLLRIIAGLDRNYSGSVLVGDERVRYPLSRVGIVFQEARLFPWMTVAGNIAFGLSERTPLNQQFVNDWVRITGLADSAKKWPRELSGGMAQRVAFARAMIRRPEVLLLDEPFSALDYVTRATLRDEFVVWLQKYPATVILVTHDIEEAVRTSSRIFVMGGSPSKILSVVQVDQSYDQSRRSSEYTGHILDMLRIKLPR